MRALILIAVAAAAAFLFFRGRQQQSAVDVAPLEAPIGSLDGDRQVLARLRAAGADLSKPTEVNYYLYFASRESADRAASRAGEGPLIASVKRAANDSSWLCLVTGAMVPAEATIHAHTRRLLALSREFGGEYDGWEAAVTR